ncbi:aspartic peptidase domain-containing protein [Gigaspora rosea]|uniref:Aspartic peptidase domain-containing protein n=1 Tax=Gigaspora rosea TaxID=44941 RepID=A0A397VDE9_9GLOM|nr:aspartic peptidase domain-containing protein [Gigaspora rosea]
MQQVFTTARRDMMINFIKFSGEIVASDINISGKVAKNVFFNLIDSVPGLIAGSGVIGMGYNPSQGFPSNFKFDTKSNFRTIPTRGIKNKLYSLYLGRAPNPFNEPNATVEQSLLTLGEIDTSLYTGNINYFSVKDKDFWEIDSTTINELIPEARIFNGFYMLPCNTNTSISFIIGGVKHTINSKDLVNGNFIHGPELPPPGWCMSAIYGSDDKEAPWHLGGTFFHTIYAVFDL